MKRIWMVGLVCLMLAGCGSQETLETISDEIVLSAMAQPRQIGVELPDDAVAPVLESDREQVYFSEDYQIILQTLSAGDLDASVRTISGCQREKLTLMQTRQDGVDRYDFVWAAAGETGDQLGRGVILDDGDYHYCLSVLRPADQEDTQVVWENVFSSFCLV